MVGRVISMFEMRNVNSYIHDSTRSDRKSYKIRKGLKMIDVILKLKEKKIFKVGTMVETIIDKHHMGTPYRCVLPCVSKSCMTLIVLQMKSLITQQKYPTEKSCIMTS